MASTETTADRPTFARSTFQEPWTRFAAWAADELKSALAYDGTTYRLEIDHFDSSAEGADSNASPSTIRRRWSLRRSKHKEQAAAEAKLAGPLLTATTQTELLTKLIGKLAEVSTPPSLRPRHAPQAVHELTDRLFAAYELDGGKALVAGCHLKDIPFIRLTRIEPISDAEGQPTEGATDEQTVVTHCYYDAQGEPIADELVKQLGLNETRAAGEPTPRLPSSLPEQIATLKQSLAGASEEGGTEASELFTIVWARHASGRLRFEFGDQSVEAPFEGWAKTLEAPPVICTRTGRETFSLTTVDDGEIVAAEEVARCEVTGNRHVTADLARCSVTGKLVEISLLKPCPQSGELVLETEFGICPRCRLSIPKTLTTQSGCQVCCGAKRVASNHPILLALQAKYPDSAKLSKAGPNLGLGKGRWQLAETDDMVILTHDGWLRRRVATFDKSTLELKYQAEASRFSNSWRPISS